MSQFLLNENNFFSIPIPISIPEKSSFQYQYVPIPKELVFSIPIPIPCQYLNIWYWYCWYLIWSHYFLQCLTSLNFHLCRLLILSVSLCFWGQPRQSLVFQWDKGHIFLLLLCMGRLCYGSSNLFFSLYLLLVVFRHSNLRLHNS